MGERASSALAAVVAVGGALMIGGCATTTGSSVPFADGTVLHFDPSAQALHMLIRYGPTTAREGSELCQLDLSREHHHGVIR